MVMVRDPFRPMLTSALVAPRRHPSSSTRSLSTAAAAAGVALSNLDLDRWPAPALYRPREDRNVRSGSPPPHFAADIPPEQESPDFARPGSSSSDLGDDHPIVRLDPRALRPGLPSPTRPRWSEPELNRGALAAPSRRRLVSPDEKASTKAKGELTHDGLTSESLSRYLSRQRNSERGNWWSESSSEESLASSPSIRHFSASVGGAQVEPEESIDSETGDQTPEDPTPTKPAHQDRQTTTTMTTSMAVPEASPFRGNGSRESSTTVTPTATVHSLKKTERPTVLDSGLLASRWAREEHFPRPESDDQTHTVAPPEQAARPPPSIDDGPTSLGSPLDRSDPGPINQVAPPPKGETTAAGRMDLLRRTSFGQFPRRRLLWKGKACFVAPPVNDDRGDGVNQPRLMSAAELAHALQGWEAQGYDTRGFDHWNWHNTPYSSDAAGQSKPVFPNADELRKAWEERLFSVSLPDLKAWDAYVNDLNERKLRALGVSTGNDPAEASMRPPSVGSRTDRQRSSPHSLPVSPPPQLPSAASHRSGPFATRAFSPPVHGAVGIDATIQGGVAMAPTRSLPGQISSLPGARGKNVASREDMYSYLPATQPSPAAQHALRPTPSQISTSVSPETVSGGVPLSMGFWSPAPLDRQHVVSPGASANNVAISMRHSQQQRQFQVQQLLRQQQREPLFPDQVLSPSPADLNIKLQAVQHHRWIRSIYRR
ncbi:MAG: hypothetical protein M1826_002169 [Phylliscum demangeonii]|nr:MAG: hypothetical protein M1826_002169 [Phylliscum demangeonii]